MKCTKLFWLAGTLLLFNTVLGQVKLPAILGNGMILQRNEAVTIWGWASPGEKVAIQFNKKNYNAQTNAQGKWSVKLLPLTAGGPYSMVIAGKNKIVINDILIGDVWLCSGQSNMVHQMRLHNTVYGKDIAEANNSNIRQFFVPNTVNLISPQADLPEGNWKEANKQNIGDFSAVAYFFAKKLYEKNKVPIGIINASWGGTPIESWISEDGFGEFPDIKETLTKNKDTAYIASQNVKSPAAKTIPAEDRGMTEKWFDPLYKPKSWRNIAIPGYWEDQGVKDLNGTVWYRREINVPESMATGTAKIFMGRIVNADVVYINGKQVGQTTYMYPQRRYEIGAGILKPGKNLIVVKVTNSFGKGGFVPDKPYQLIANNDTINLTGYWQYKVGSVIVPSKTFGGMGINLQNQPTALYNSMIAPIIDYKIKGIAWYQGESNTGNARAYTGLQTALIKNWRNKWKNNKLPFIFVQLPGFMDYNYLPVESQWAEFREAQAKTLEVPGTAMAVAIDLGEWNDIHPDGKKEVGERLALAAEKTAYNENIISSGPVLKSYAIEDNKIVLQFTNAPKGLTTSDGEVPAEFAIAGDDKQFVWAEAKIEGDKIILWNGDVSNPKYVRYAWADNPVNPNLINAEGLPAAPFRTDK